MDSEQIIFALVNARDFISQSPANQKDTRTEIKETIVNPNFVKSLNKSLSLLKPIDELITLFQSDAVPVSDVYVAFLDLPSKFSEGDTGFEKREKDYLKKIVDERFQFVYGDAHGLGYLLDPRYTGEKLDRKLREELEDLLLSLAVENGTHLNSNFSPRTCLSANTGWA